MEGGLPDYFEIRSCGDAKVIRTVIDHSNGPSCPTSMQRQRHRIQSRKTTWSRQRHTPIIYVDQYPSSKRGFRARRPDAGRDGSLFTRRSNRIPPESRGGGRLRQTCPWLRGSRKGDETKKLALWPTSIRQKMVRNNRSLAGGHRTRTN